jgi:hypothetical protein
MPETTVHFQVPYPVLTVPATKLREAAVLFADFLTAGVASEVEAAEALGRLVAEAAEARDGGLPPEVTWERRDSEFIDAWRRRRAGQSLQALVGRYVEECAEGR